MVDINYTNPFTSETSTQLKQINRDIGNSAPLNGITDAVFSTIPPLPPSLSANGTAISIVSATAIATSISAPSISETSVGIVNNSVGESIVVVGKNGLTPLQLENAGVIKKGSATVVIRSINGNIPLSRAMPDRIFTGKFGVNTLADLTMNSDASSKIIASLAAVGVKKLESDEVINGTEPSTIIVGAVSTEVLPSNNINSVSGKMVSSKTLASISSYINKLGAISDKISVAAGAASLIAQLSKGFPSKVPVNLEAEANKLTIPKLPSLGDIDKIKSKAGSLTIPDIKSGITDSISSAKGKLSSKLFPKDNPDSIKIPPLK